MMTGRRKEGSSEVWIVFHLLNWMVWYTGSLLVKIHQPVCLCIAHVSVCITYCIKIFTESNLHLCFIS